MLKLDCECGVTFVDVPSFDLHTDLMVTQRNSKIVKNALMQTVVPKTIARKAQAAAKKRGITVSEWLRESIIAELSLG